MGDYWGERMLQNQTSLAAILTELRNTCASAHSKTIDFLHDPEELNNAIAVRVSQRDFVELIQQIKPKVVFVFGPHFDARRSTLDSILPDQDEDADELRSETLNEIENDPLVKSLIKRFQKFDDQLEFLAASFFDGIVTYHFFESAHWADDFHEQLEQYLDTQEDLRLERIEVDNAREHGEFERAMTQLISDPRFSAPKASRAKRLYLAETLFPEMPEYDRRKLVERGELKLWAG